MRFRRGVSSGSMASFFTWSGWQGYPPPLPGHDPESIGSSRHYRWLLWIVQGIFGLNLLDGVFTLTWVWMGLATEANIMMRDLVHFNPVAFMVAKISLVCLGTLLLWRYRRHRLAVVAIFLTLYVYAVVLLYHLDFAITLLRG